MTIIEAIEEVDVRGILGGEGHYRLTFKTRRRLSTRIKGVMQRLNPADAFNRLMRRPSPQFSNWPYRVDAISERGPRVVYIDIECAIMPEDLEHDVPDRERDTKDNLARHKGLLRGSNSGFVALYADTRDRLLNEPHEAVTGPVWIAQGAAVSKPNKILARRLLDVMETVIFRVRYDSLGRLRQLKHEYGFNCPCGEQLLPLFIKRCNLALREHRAKKWRNGTL